RSNLLNVKEVLGQITLEPAAYLSDRVAQYIIVRLVNQAQVFVRDGAILDIWERQQNYTVIGDSNKVDEISDRLVRLIVMRVMPTVKPDLEKLLRHSLQRALVTNDIYDGLKQIPGLISLPDEALNSIANYLAEATCEVLSSSYLDEQGRVLLDQLSYDFRHALGYELRTRANSEELRVLVADLLEEFKVNYVQQSDGYDPEVTLQEVELLQQSARQ
ncbi:MAG: hypothetical protein AAF978_09910, partial [Cyanobacteria bacterium P01_E01_bin.48]